MVKFKIYDTRQKKFVGQGASDKVWTERYKLGIWNNQVNDTQLDKMFRIMNNNDKHLGLYVKIDGRYKLVTREIIATIESIHKRGEPERKASRKKIRDETKQHDIKRCQRDMKNGKKRNISSREHKRLTRRKKACKIFLKKNRAMTMTKTRK